MNVPAAGLRFRAQPRSVFSMSNHSAAKGTVVPHPSPRPGVVHLDFGNGTRVTNTVKVGRFILIRTDASHRRATRVIGRRNAIRAGQHAANDDSVTSRR